MVPTGIRKRTGVVPVFIGTNKGHLVYQLNGMENIYLMRDDLNGALAFVTIFFFKKKRRQVRLAVLESDLNWWILLYYFHVRTLIEKPGLCIECITSGCVLFFFLWHCGYWQDIKL
jgi:hypothetical protein